MKGGGRIAEKEEEMGQEEKRETKANERWEIKRSRRTEEE